MCLQNEKEDFSLRHKEMARNWSHSPDCVGCLRLCQMQSDTINFEFSDFTLLALIDTRKLKQQMWSKCWLRKGKKYSFLIYLVLFKNRLFLFYLRNMENILIIGKSFWNKCLSISHLKVTWSYMEFKPPISNLLSFLLHCYLQSQEGKIKKNL